jgi:hypothetical protein
VAKSRRPRKPRRTTAQRIEAGRPDQTHDMGEAEPADKAEPAGEPEAAKDRQAEHDKAAWAAGLPAALFVALAVTSSIVTLFTEPPRVGVIVGLAILFAGVVVWIIRVRTRSRRIQRLLGPALIIVGVAVSGLGFHGWYDKKVAQQTANLTDTCAEASTVVVAWNATSTAELTSAFTAPVIAQTRSHLLDAITALDAAANKSGSTQAKRLASRLEIGLTQEASSGLFSETGLKAQRGLQHTMASLHALCAHSSRAMSNVRAWHPVSSGDFCEAMHHVIGLGASSDTRKRYIAFENGYATFYNLLPYVASQDLQQIGVVMAEGIREIENAQRHNLYLVRLLATALDMARVPCKAAHVNLEHIKSPHFAVSKPNSSQDTVMAKVGNSLKDCRPTEIYGTTVIVIEMQCSIGPAQLQVFTKKINCASWFAAHPASSSQRYVCGPSWVVQVSNVIDEITAAAETGGLPEPLSSAKQPAGHA